MSSFAKIDTNNIVTQVLVAEKNFINSGLVGDEFLWVQTSYNTKAGKHYSANTSNVEDDLYPLRKNFAGVGYTYDKVRDAFIPPKPYDSWTLDEDTCQWDAPVAYPDDDKFYVWNEDTTSWDLNE